MRPSLLIVPADYAPILKKFHLPYRVSGEWLISGQVCTQHTWLLFVSVMAVDTPALLLSLLPILVKEKIAFRLIKNQDSQLSLNAGEMLEVNFGKVITLYPCDLQQANRLIPLLLPFTDRSRGPQLDDCIRLGKTLYAGYAASTDEEGNPTTITIPTIPFPSASPIRRMLPKVVGKRYIPIKMIHSSVKTTLYKAFFLPTLRICLLKRGRSYLADDLYGRHIRHRFEWEMKCIRRFQPIVPVPAVLSFFQATGDFYLELEYISYPSLRTWIQLIYSGKTWTTLRSDVKLTLLTTFSAILLLVDRVHQEECILCDITDTNFLIPYHKKDTTKGPVLIDLELLYDLHHRQPMPPFRWGTPGFAAPEQMKGHIPTFRNDVYSCGALLLLFLLGAHPREILPARRSTLKEVLSSLRIPAGLSNLVIQSVANNPLERGTMATLRAGIKEQLEQLITETPSLSL